MMTSSPRLTSAKRADSLVLASWTFTVRLMSRGLVGRHRLVDLVRLRRRVKLRSSGTTEYPIGICCCSEGRATEGAAMDHHTHHGPHHHDSHAAPATSATPAEHSATTTHPEHADHTGHDHRAHDKHAGHAPAMFRDRFWISLVLTVPVVVYADMVQTWFGYTAPEFPGSTLIAPVLGAVVFAYGGGPFLAGAVRELRDRRPGMMLLIGMAISVAFAASLASSLGLFAVEVWWELSLLIVVMLLGH